MDNLGYLFAAYSLIFLFIALYVLFIGRRQARLEDELSRLEAHVRETEKDLPASVGKESGGSF